MFCQSSPPCAQTESARQYTSVYRKSRFENLNSISRRCRRERLQQSSPTQVTWCHIPEAKSAGICECNRGDHSCVAWIECSAFCNNGRADFAAFARQWQTWISNRVLKVARRRDDIVMVDVSSQANSVLLLGSFRRGNLIDNAHFLSYQFRNVTYGPI